MLETGLLGRTLHLAISLLSIHETHKILTYHVAILLLVIGLCRLFAWHDWIESSLLTGSSIIKIWVKGENRCQKAERSKWRKRRYLHLILTEARVALLISCLALLWYNSHGICGVLRAGRLGEHLAWKGGSQLILGFILITFGKRTHF